MGRADGVWLAPDVFAAVMATAILSVAAGDQSYYVVDDALAALATVTFVVLSLIGLLQLVRAPALLRSRARAPDVALRLFTFVAACTVLAARFHTCRSVTWVLAAAAAVVWLVLVPLVFVDVRSRPTSQLRRHAHGSWLLSSVATAGLAITAADLAGHSRWRGWPALSAGMLVLSLLLYVVTAWLIGRRTVTTPVVAKVITPDTWIVMGALAIATLAGVRLRAALTSRGASAWATGVLHPTILVLWVAATAWIPVLLGAEIWRFSRRPGHVHYAGVWWSAVFPLGMYATATQATAHACRLPVLTTISLVAFWAGFVLWVLVAAGFGHLAVTAASNASGHERPVR